MLEPIDNNITSKEFITIIISVVLTFIGTIYYDVYKKEISSATVKFTKLFFKYGVPFYGIVHLYTHDFIFDKWFLISFSFCLSSIFLQVCYDIYHKLLELHIRQLGLIKELDERTRIEKKD